MLRYLSTRYVIGLAWSLCTGLSLAAQSLIPNLSHPNVHQLSERVYALIGDLDVPNEKNQGFICNSVFILTNTGVVVVDSGGSLQIGQMLIQEIKKRTKKPITHVINTHHHADHWLGNQAFASLQPRPIIMAHPYMLTRAKQSGAEFIKFMSDLTKGASHGTEVVLPDATLKGDESLVIGDLAFKFYHPKHAHTEGDIAVYLPAEKILLPGDILFHQRTPGFQDASPLGNAQALRELLTLDVRQVVPGHGPVTDASGMRQMLDYIDLLAALVKKYYAQGLQDFEMKEKISQDMGKYRNLSGFAERFGVNVNRMFLEIEARNF